ncbi:MAG: DUF3040 domain-containing protein [Propioniciclava sp.]
MALSEQEQRRFEQLAADLAAEDPKLAHTMRGANNGTLHRRRAAGAGIIFLVGIGALIAGMEFGWILSVAGFVIMFFAAIVALSAWRQVSPSGEESDSTPDSGRFDRTGDQWRKQKDDGL